MSDLFAALSVDARAALCPLLYDLGGSAAPGDVVATLATGIVQVVRACAAVVFLVEDGALHAAHAAGPAAGSLAGAGMRLGEGTSGNAALTGAPARGPAPSGECGVEAAGEFAMFRSVLAWPLVRNGRTLAVLSLYRRRREPFGADAVCLLEVICGKAAAALELALECDWYRRTSLLDRATGLPNSRELFGRLDGELSRSRRSRSAISILVCRLAGAGPPPEALLGRLGAHFRRHCRDYDYVGWTGERFVFLLPGATASVAWTRLEALRCLPDILPFQLLASAAFFPEDGTDAEDLLAAAERRWQY